jgi:hypothetical protein
MLPSSRSQARTCSCPFLPACCVSLLAYCTHVSLLLLGCQELVACWAFHARTKLPSLSLACSLHSLPLSLHPPSCTLFQYQSFVLFVFLSSAQLGRKLLGRGSPVTSGLVDIRDLGLLRLFQFLFLYGLMALTHRWQNCHLGVPLNSVFPGWTFETSGVIVFWGSFFVARPRWPSPIGGKTATLLASTVGALPWRCETVGMGIGRTSSRSCCTTPKVRSLDGGARALQRVGLKPCMLHVALLC